MTGFLVDNAQTSERYQGLIIRKGFLWSAYPAYTNSKIERMDFCLLEKSRGPWC